MPMKLVHFFIAILLVWQAQADTKPEWQTIDIREDLYSRREQEINDGVDFDLANGKLLESINSYSPTVSYGRAPGISYQQARQLLDEVGRDNKSIISQPQYETSNVLGLCFARAIFFHLMLLRYGVNKDSIKKIFVVGPMSGSGDIKWQFHTATIVKDSSSGKWWVLDTTFNDPISVTEWVRQMKGRSEDTTYRVLRSNLVDKTKSLRFYITEPEKIGPSGWEYNIQSGGLFDPFYNGYFKDVFDLIRKKVIGPDQKFNKGLRFRCESLFSDD